MQREHRDLDSEADEERKEGRDLEAPGPPVTGRLQGRHVERVRIGGKVDREDTEQHE